MSARQKIEALIEKKRQENADLRAQIDKNEVYVQGLQDSLRFLPKESVNGASSEVTLRPGTELAKARDYIRKVGRPVPIAELLEVLGKPVNNDTRASVAGSIGWYVRRKQVFTRPAPNTFSLFELDASTKSEGSDVIEEVDSNENGV